MRPAPLLLLLAGCTGAPNVGPKGAAPPPSPSSPSSAAEPAPRTPAQTKAWLCECHRRSGMAGDCEDQGFDSPDQDCLRTYADCARALACLRGEPGVGPKCLPGFRNAGAISSCARICRERSECAAGEACTAEWGPPSVCWPE